MTTDFAFVSRLADGFFARKTIKDTLNTVSELEITGWEKWLQIEFAKYCKSHPEISEWKRELRYELDRRLSKNKATCAIDFFIRQKHKHSPMGIEIKQHRSARSCIKAMLDDKEKVRRIRLSSDDLRGVWCVGIHENTNKCVHNLVAFCAKEQGIDLDPNQVFTQRIGRTAYSVTVF